MPSLFTKQCKRTDILKPEGYLLDQIKTTTQYLGINIPKEIGAAVKRLGIYPSERPAAIKAPENPLFALQETFKNMDQVTISKVGDKIILNGKSVEGDRARGREKQAVCQSQAFF